MRVLQSWLLAVAAFLPFLFPSVLAVFADEAWKVDYHYPLLGEPGESTTFFHQPNPASKASLVYTLSRRGVLGAVNPRDGTIVWRQLLANDGLSSNISFLRAGEGQDVVVSGIGSEVAAWSAGDGRLAWQRNLHGQVEDVEILELEDAAAQTTVKDVIALSSGDSPAMFRFDGASGDIKWQYNIDSGDTPYQVSASSTDVFVILLHKTLLGYLKIKVVSLDPVTGRKTDEYTLSSESELASAQNIIAVGANSASPIIAWTDAAHSVLKINILGSKTVSSFNVEKHDQLPVTSIRIHAPYHSNSLAHFLVHFETAESHWAEVYHIDLKKSKISQAYSLPKLAGKGAFATSTSDANVYFTRITRDEVLTVSSASHGILGRWPIAGFGIAASAGEEIDPVHSVSEISIKNGAVSAIRSAVLLSTGDWALYREGLPQWTRPEMLASIYAATFVTPSSVKAFEQELEVESHSNFVSAYIHRVARHIADFQLIPALLPAIPQRFLSAFLGNTADGGISADTFGFHQIIACLIDHDRIVGLDAGDPSKILWNRKVSPSLDAAGLAVETVTVLLGDSTAEIKVKASEGDHNRLEFVQEPTNPDAAAAASVTYTLRDGQLIAQNATDATATPLWHFSPTPDERVLSLVPRPVNDPVASIGKVLGDRRVLYKFLDPNLALLVTAKTSSNTAYFYLLNTVSGAILFSSSHSNIDLSAPIASILSENWFAYTFTSDASPSSPKGHHLVVGELFESLIPNDRGPLTSHSNFSSLSYDPSPFPLLTSYQIPEPISHLAVTRTLQGITSRQLLAVLPLSNSIIGIPYFVLDPRRPAHRDPTKDEQAEGLVRYEPVIEFDPKWFLSHAREVLGLSNIVTAAALIESTSLVFAYGLDVFGTRLSPSFNFDVLGRDFNKFQMLATVAGLAVGTLVVAPLVARKQINMRWQFT